MRRGGTACYIKAYDIPEVMLGMNAFYLGLQKYNPTATLRSITINTWGDPFVETLVAGYLLQDEFNCELLSTQTNNMQPLRSFAEANRYVIGSNADSHILLGTLTIT
jgi:basic membrane lipoprotein Med (substrate-binding protein (PBP1-ABC) superfamily)